MTDNDRHQLIEQIHSSGHGLVLAITGGGSGAIASLLEVPGASATVLEAIVPYAATALQSWLGGPPDHYCTERTARAMAMAAFERARRLSTAEPRTLRGIGATASMATTRPKRGPHRVHVAWQSAEATVAISCELTKGERTRAEEEAVAGGLVLSAVAEACGVETDSLVDPAIAADVRRRETNAPQSWTELLMGNRASVVVEEKPTTGDPLQPTSESDAPVVLFPGAFNPLHEGHARMGAVAEQRLRLPVTFELSVTNVDKPPLDFLEIADRLQGLAGRRVLLTCAPTFTEKSQVVPGAVFVVGIDTLLRIAEPRYYGGDESHRDAAIDTIAQQGCRFLVFGRVIGDRYTGLDDLSLPRELRALCDEVPESVFRADISSTELRAKRDI